MRFSADQDDREKDDDDNKDGNEKKLPHRALAALYNLPKGSDYSCPQLTDLDISHH